MHTMVKALKVIVALITLGGIAWIVRLGVLGYSGYCPAEERVLSDQERIAIVVAQIVAQDPPVISMQMTDSDGRTYLDNQQPKHPIRYTSIAEFLVLNPNCCEVVQSAPESGPIDLLDRISGRIAAYVHVKYRVRYLDDAGQPMETTANPYYAITNCGRPWSGI